jgi:hypothetical protein
MTAQETLEMQFKKILTTQLALDKKEWPAQVLPGGRIISTSMKAVQDAAGRVRGLPGIWPFAHGSKKHITEVLADGAWAGHRCFIIGGGPSLRGFDFAQLKGEKIIVINRAFEVCPFADIMFSMDNRFYNWLIRGQLPGSLEKFMAFKGLKIWLEVSNNSYHHGIYYVVGLPTDGFPHSLKAGIYHGNHSGYGALQLALVLGADPIYLLGYDMKHQGKATHFHSGYPSRQGAHTLLSFKSGLERLAPMIRKAGRKVINLNPDSALKCFEFGNLNEVLNDTIADRPADSPGQAQAVSPSQEA